MSEWGAISVGVPQGSILGLLRVPGPLLFSVYVNDLPTVVKHSQMKMYADDTELHIMHIIYFLCNMIFSVILMQSRLG